MFTNSEIPRFSTDYVNCCSVTASLLKFPFVELKEYVIAKPARRLVVAISKDFCLKTVGFFAFSEGIATPVFALARNDSVYRLLHKLLFISFFPLLTLAKSCGIL